MSVYASIIQSERTTLPPSEPKKPYKDLKVLKALDPKEIANGGTRHSFLVGSETVNGTAFLKVDIYPYTLHPASIALATKKEEKFIDDGLTTAADIDAMRAQFQQEGARKAKDAAGDNDDPTALEANALAKTENILTGIRINVEKIIGLQVSAGQEPDPTNFTPESVVGAVFSGNVQPGGLGDSTEVKGVYVISKKTAKTA